MWAHEMVCYMRGQICESLNHKTPKLIQVDETFVKLRNIFVKQMSPSGYIFID